MAGLDKGLQVTWTVIVIVSAWIGSHANALTGWIRQGILMACALGWISLDAQQQAIVFMFISGSFDLFTEKQTVPKSRVGERIDEKVAQQVTAITGTGDGTPAGAVLTTNKENVL